MPQIADVLADVEPRVAGPVRAGQRRPAAARPRGPRRRAAPRASTPADWPSLHAWFTGDPRPSSDADVVPPARHRGDAVPAHQPAAHRLQRLEREHGRYADLVRLAGLVRRRRPTTTRTPCGRRAFGLYSCRHLGFPADDPERPVPRRRSWWTAPPRRGAADAAAHRQAHSRRAHRPRTEDYSAAKAARARRARSGPRRRRRDAPRRAGAPPGPLDRVRLSDAARDELLDVYAACLARATGGAEPTPTGAGIPLTSARRCLDGPATPRAATRRCVSPSGRLTLVDRQPERRGRRRRARRRRSRGRGPGVAAAEGAAQ